MTSHANHPFYLVDQNPRPLTGAIGAMLTMTGMIKWFHQYNQELLMIGLTIMLLWKTTMQLWHSPRRISLRALLPSAFAPQRSPSLLNSYIMFNILT